MRRAASVKDSHIRSAGDKRGGSNQAGRNVARCRRGRFIRIAVPTRRHHVYRIESSGGSKLNRPEYWGDPEL